MRLKTLIATLGIVLAFAATSAFADCPASCPGTTTYTVTGNMDIGASATAMFSGNGTGGQAMAGGQFNGTMSTIKILPANTNGAAWNINAQTSGGFVTPTTGALTNIPTFGNTTGNSWFHMDISIPNQ